MILGVAILTFIAFALAICYFPFLFGLFGLLSCIIAGATDILVTPAV
jgi:hypothetical protein